MVTSRVWFTAAQKAELWERWKNGQSAGAISRALERKHKTARQDPPQGHGDCCCCACQAHRQAA
jgi:transposase, IS30 family